MGLAARIGTDKRKETNTLRVREINRVFLMNVATSPSSSHDASLPASFLTGETVDVDAACVQEWFEAQVRRTPDAVALELDGSALSYRELNERANRLAHYLRGRGVGPDVLVGVSMERSFDLVVSIYGILKAGGAYVPLDPAYPLERLQYMVQAAKVPVLVTRGSCSHLFSGLQGVDVVLLDESRSEIDDCSNRDPEPQATRDNLIYVIFTSGSTGQPKAAAVYHRGFANLVQWFTDEFEITSDDHALLVSSLSFDLTQKNLYATLVRGGTLHLYPPGPYDVSVLSRLIHDRGITLINCTPSAFYPLIDPFDDACATALASLRIVFLGGEPISIARIRPWLEHALCEAEVANTYGPTECTDICGFHRLTRSNLEHYEFVPLGRPVNNVQMLIVNQEMELCPIGVAGELCVGGAGVGAGYINDPQMTQAKFVPNRLTELSGPTLYRTGDQARWHQDGVIEFLGRLDHQVKVRGFRIELPEIERAVETHPAVSESIVVVRPDAGGGDPQLVCCFTEFGEQAVSIADLRCHLSKRLPAHMVPGSFEGFGVFPLSPNGKVDRKALGELVSERHHRSSPSPAVPLSALEGQIRTAWLQILGRGEVGLDDNFFDLGGDSLSLARLHQILEKLLDRKFPLTDLFAHTTIRSMANHLSSDSHAGGMHQDVRQRARMQRKVRAAQRRNRG